MSNYDMDTLLGTYADWVAWLKEKETNLEGQLARMKGKEQAATPAEAETEAAEGAPVTVAPTTEQVEPATDAPAQPVAPATEAPAVVPAEAEAEAATPAPVETDEDDDWL